MQAMTPTKFIHHHCAHLASSIDTSVSLPGPRTVPNAGTLKSERKRSLSTAGLATGLTAVIMLLGGCAAGPDYVRPQMDTPAAFKEDTAWKTATPQQIDPNHSWWEIYGDSTLNTLITEANQANQNIR